MAAAKGKPKSKPPGTEWRELKERLEALGAERVKVGGFDLDGVLRGKYISLKKLESSLVGGFGFCDVIFGWDVEDQLYDNSKVTGWDSGYPDITAALDLSTLHRIPSEPGVAGLLCDFQQKNGKVHPACPRSLLKKVVARSEKAGLAPRMGAELEFFIFRETRDSLQEKGFQRLQPLDPGMFGYSWLRTGQDAELMEDIWKSCAESGIELEGLHTETGPGVYEAAIAYSDPVRVADQAALFKTLVRQRAHAHGLTATFMAKCNAELPGTSGHLHQSLWRGNRNAFFERRGGHGMSTLMRRYIAGQMALMADWTALYNPTINSYKRTVPGVWAPLGASWGVENRTCSIRVVSPGSERALRVEYRQPAADMNPYVAMAASLAAGLWGVERGLELGPETVGDAGQGEQPLPATLNDAIPRLSKSRAAKRMLGAEFVDHYVRTRDWEVRQYQRAVTDWELKRYFETV